jgi:hypothetical protein
LQITKVAKTVLSIEKTTGRFEVEDFAIHIQSLGFVFLAPWALAGAVLQ